MVHDMADREDALGECRMNLAITTSKHLLVLDTETFTVRIANSRAGIYYGLCADTKAGVLYVGARNSASGPYDEVSRAGERGSMLVLNDRMAVIANLAPDFPLRDMHAATLFDGKLWVVCSYDNMVAVHDLRSGTWDRWYPAPNPEDRHRDVHHFNTLQPFDGRLLLVAHNRGPSSLLEYHYPGLDLLQATDMGVHTHDLLIRDGDLHCLSSFDGTVLANRTAKVFTGHYPRGFAFHDGRFYVGISTFAPRQARKDQSATVRIFNADWTLAGNIRLPDVGMIFQIAPLDGFPIHTAHLPELPGAEFVKGGYCSSFPAPSYELGSPQTDGLLNRNEWHRAEGNGRWTAARRAGMRIVVNPGSRRLCVRLATPVRGIKVSILLQDTPVASFAFRQAGGRTQCCTIPAGLTGECTLEIRVDRLWHPDKTIAGSADSRGLGVFVEEVWTEAAGTKI
ncbi:hypothetical protein [Azospirillum sp. Sh1]|uniref:hypothetical protein n=1 Tax=Azospirillum sp. Sh1 TaxID=2607285 RepID=UPI0011ED71D6|nr:hypothetical protein [Azospirillum sp. Sh1]KAA0579238.1 hypothetical protein FZ029_07320 [Azospirillum sp. Sh1]